MAAPAATPRDDDIAGQIESFLDADPEFAAEGDPEERKEGAKKSAAAESEPAKVDESTDTTPAQAVDDEGGAEAAAAAAAKAKSDAEGDPADADDADAVTSVSALAELFEASEDEVLEGLSVVPAEGAEPVSLKAIIARYNEAPPGPDPRVEQARADFEAKRTEMEQQYGAGMAKLQELSGGMLALMKHDRAEMERVKQIDPEQYIRLQESVEARQKIVTDAIEEMQGRHRAWQQENSDDLAASYQREMELVTTKMPAWKDPEKAKAAMEQVQKTLLDVGYTQAEIEGISDHREMLTAWKASEYDRLTATKKGTLERKVLRLPKSNLKRSARDEGASAREAKKAEGSKWERLEQSGDERDAAALMFDMIDD
jgi:hypothetical protein